MDLPLYEVVWSFYQSIASDCPLSMAKAIMLMVIWCKPECRLQSRPLHSRESFVMELFTDRIILEYAELLMLLFLIYMENGQICNFTLVCSVWKVRAMTGS